MFERLGTCDTAALCHVSDDEDGGAEFLCRAHQSCGALSHLTHVARRAVKCFGVHRLDGIDHCDHGPRGFKMREDCFEMRLGQKLDIAGAFGQSIGAQFHLQRALFATDVERRVPQALQPRNHLQQQR